MNSGCQIAEIKKSFINLLERIVDYKKFNDDWQGKKAELQQLDSLYQDELQNANIEKILDSYLESKERQAVALSNDRMRASDGGPGSGNFGHKGRPGQVGGSSSEGGSDLNKVSVNPTLADIDEHLASVNVRKGDVVKVFGLRKDVLLTHLQNRLKDGKNWRGVFKNEDAYNEAKATLDDMIKNGVAEDDKELIKLKRGIARWDFIQGLAGKLEGDEPKADEPKVDKKQKEKSLEAETKEETKVDEPKQEETKADEPLGEDEIETDLVFKSRAIEKKTFDLWGKQLSDPMSIETALRDMGISGTFSDDVMTRASALIQDIGIGDFKPNHLQRVFKDEWIDGVKNGLISPAFLDKLIEKVKKDVNRVATITSNFYSPRFFVENIKNLAGFLEIKKRQEKSGLTQEKFDSIKEKNRDFPTLPAVESKVDRIEAKIDTVKLKSKLSDAGDVGKKVVADLRAYDTIKVSKVNVDKELKKRKFGEKVFADGKVIEGVMDDEASADMVKKHIANPSISLMWNILNELNKKVMGAHGEKTILEVAQGMLDDNKKSHKTAYYKSLVSGVQRIDEVMGKAKYYTPFERHMNHDRHNEFAKAQMVMLMTEDFHATAKELGVEANNGFTDYLERAVNSRVAHRNKEREGMRSVLATYGKMAVNLLKSEDVVTQTKQGRYLNQLENASTKPNIQNELINTKIEKTERTVGKNNRAVMDSVFHGMGINWDDFYNYKGERSEYGISEGIAIETAYELMMVDGERQSQFEYISSTEKTNYKMLNTNELKQLITAMTRAGGYYSPIKAPNKFGSQNLISMLAATGKIANSNDRKCIRYEDEGGEYRNYDFKVGDTIMFDGMHATTDKNFADTFARGCFGEGKPCRFEVEGDYPYLDLEPFVWNGKWVVEYEQLMAGFFKVKSVENDVPFDIVNHDGERIQGNERVVKLEFDWDRLDEFLSLQARSFANYYNMYKKDDKDKSVLW